MRTLRIKWAPRDTHTTGCKSRALRPASASPPTASAAPLSPDEITKFAGIDVAIASNLSKRSLKFFPFALPLSDQRGCLAQLAFLWATLIARTTLSSAFFRKSAAAKKVGQEGLGLWRENAARVQQFNDGAGVPTLGFFDSDPPSERGGNIGVQ